MRSMALKIVLTGALSLAAAADALAADDARAMVSQLQAAILQNQPMTANYDAIISAGPQALSYVEPLMHENVALRIAAGVIAGRIAVNTDAPQAEELLVRLANDSSPAVAYWGYHGILKSRVLDEREAEEWVVRSLDRRRPLAIRLMGCDAARERRVEAAIPRLAELIRRQADRYQPLKQSIFVEEVEIQPEPTRPTREPRRPERPERPGRRDRFDDPMDLDPWEEDEFYDDMYEMERERRPQYETRPIDPLESRRPVVAEAATRLERTPAVEQIRRAGLALEAVTGEDFGFGKANSWELEDVISRALRWYERNADRYEARPEVQEVQEEG